MSLALTPEQLYELTHKRRPSAQVIALRAMGVDHRVRPDGTVYVLREALQPELANAKVHGTDEFQIRF